MQANDQLVSYQEARKSVQRARVLRIFLAHLVMFVLGNIFLGLWNSLTYYRLDNELIWMPIPLIFWGTGVLIHYIVSVVLFDEWWASDESAIQSRSGVSVSASGNI